MEDINYANDYTIYNSVRAGWLEAVENDAIKGNAPQYNDLRGLLKRAKYCVDKLRAIPLNDKKLKRLGLTPIWELAKGVLMDVFNFTEEEAYAKCKEYDLMNDAVPPAKKEVVIREPKVYAERGMTYMFQSVIKKTGSIEFRGPKVTAKHKWLLDVIAHILNYRIYNLKNGKEAGEQMEIVTFTDDDVRQITGRHDISGREIKRLFEEVVLVQACGESQILYEDGMWVNTLIGGPLFDRWEVKSWGIASKRTGIPAESKVKHKYMVSLNTPIGATSLWNLLCGKGLALPRKKFYFLKPQEQEIYRYFSMWKGHPYVQLNYEQMCKLLGLSTSARRPDRQIERIAGWLDELKAAGLLNWEKTKEGKRTIFFLSLKKEHLPLMGLIGE